MVSFKMLKPSFLAWLLLVVSVTVEVSSSEQEEYQTYIIHMDHSLKPDSHPTHESWHRFTLRSLSNPVDDDAMFVYAYNNVMHGFSARLTPSQLSEIEKSPAHIATHKESFAKLLTTRSTEFLGLSHHHGLWPTALYGEGVIIGVIDTGVWPESESFNDRGMPPVPERWKGKCENETGFSVSFCNKKLIGARFFRKGMEVVRNTTSAEYEPSSPRDGDGHGTHTSSTAAGNWVVGASHFGYAKGTARGVAPRAHVAMYKVIWGTESIQATISDILAGMDQAIADGVDVMSISLGVDQVPYFKDIMAIAALSAIEQGINVVCAAGNDFTRNSIYNGAPWITTIGASTLDRSFVGTMTLGNGLTLEGTTYFPENVYIRNRQLYYSYDDSRKAVCDSQSLNTTEISDKVVICDNQGTDRDIYSQMEALKEAGAYAAIIISDHTSNLFPEDYIIPAIIVPKSAGSSIKEYTTSKQNATVMQMTFVLTRVGVEPAPQVADFSSKGPDPVNPGILKPDIIAPGVDVLAAYMPNGFMDLRGQYKLMTDYALLSGTSMAAPHVAGVTALLKAVHPDWSPAAIRSSMMTTAYTNSNDGAIIKNQLLNLTSTPLDFGAGHVDPNKAVDPGLVYDLEFQDYVNFLCSLNYTENQMKAILRRSQWDCNKARYDLNYASFVVMADSHRLTRKSFTRVVTNVGGNNSTYNVLLTSSSDGLKMKAEPSILKFTERHQKQIFSLHVEVDIYQARLPAYGFLKWIDQHNHTVSSPVVVISS